MTEPHPRRSITRAGVLAALPGLLAITVQSGALAGCADDDLAAFAVELSTESTFIGSKCMAWDGEAYAVAWTARSDVMGSIVHARVAPDGSVVAEPKVLFEGLGQEVNACRLLVRGDSYVMLFLDSGGDLQDFRFSRSGAIQQSPTVFLDSVLEFDVAERDGRYAVLFTKRKEGFATGLKFEGDELGHIIGSDDNPDIGPTLRWPDDSDTLIGLWEDADDIELALIPPDEPKSYVEVNVIENASGLSAPALTVSPGGAVWTAWLDDQVPMFQPVDRLGRLFWAAPAALASERRDVSTQLALVTVAAGPATSDPDIANVAGDYAVWCSDFQTSLPQIYAAKLDPRPSAVPPEAIPLTDRRFAFRDPFPVASPSGFAVVYEGDIDGTERVLWSAFPLLH